MIEGKVERVRLCKKDRRGEVEVERDACKDIQTDRLNREID